MSRLLLLYLTLVIGVMFVLFPQWDGSYMTPDPFLFYDFPIIKGEQSGIALESYAYMIAEHIVLIIFTGIIANESVEYRKAVWVFFWLFVADLVDFILSYNSIWGHVYIKQYEIPVSMNTASFTIFGLTILYVWMKKQFSE